MRPSGPGAQQPRRSHHLFAALGSLNGDGGVMFAGAASMTPMKSVNWPAYVIQFGRRPCLCAGLMGRTRVLREGKLKSARRAQLPGVAEVAVEAATAAAAAAVSR